MMAPFEALAEVPGALIEVEEWLAALERIISRTRGNSSAAPVGR